MIIEFSTYLKFLILILSLNLLQMLISDPHIYYFIMSHHELSSHV